MIWAVADDDSHHFKPEDADDPDKTRPGRGWVMVRADTLTAEAIVRALRRGEFYASTGVTLKSYTVTRSTVALEIIPRGDSRHRIEFVGREGRVLATTNGNTARYSITGNEGYVRIRITDSNGRRAWTQPVVLR
jgi:hypothetical protein